MTFCSKCTRALSFEIFWQAHDFEESLTVCLMDVRRVFLNVSLSLSLFLSLFLALSLSRSLALSLSLSPDRSIDRFKIPKPSPKGGGTSDGAAVSRERLGDWDGPMEV